MPSIPASAIFAAAAALAGEMVDPAGTGSTVFVPDADTLARLTARLNEHLPAIWNAQTWDDVTRVAQWRLFNAAWFTPQIIPAQEQVVIDPDGNLAYLCLRTPVPSPGVGLVVPPLSDTTKWIQLRPRYTEFQDWTASGIFTAGTVVRYQQSSGGAWYEGYYVATRDVPQGITPPSPVPAPVTPVGGDWLRLDNRSLAFAKPDGVGDIVNVHAQDPRVYVTDPLAYSLTSDGVLVAGYPASAWFTYRLLCPYLWGAPFDASAAYQVGDQVFYVAGASGDFYEVLGTTTPGQTPENAATLFAKVEIPQRFGRYLAAKVAADWLRWDGQVEKAGDQDNDANRELDRLHFNFTRQQRQARRLPVVGRPYER